MDFGWRIAIIAAASYLLGNVNFARIIASAMKKDITKMGSGNPGTMNMARTFGFKYAVLTLVLDMAKGAVAALAGCLFLEYPDTLVSRLGVYVGGAAVIAGHMFPVVYYFVGGKGIASAIGVFIVADYRFALPLFVLAWVVLAITHYGSIASLVCITAMTAIEYVKIYAFGVIDYYLAVSILLGATFALILWSHRRNLVNLARGKERRMDLIALIKGRKNAGG